MPNPVVHFEIGSRNREQSEKFYTQLFDWKTTAAGPATLIEDGGIGGHFTELGHEPFHYTMFYVQVDDIAATLDKAESLGGKRLVGPISVPTGAFAWFTDVDGNTIGLWKPAATA